MSALERERIHELQQHLSRARRALEQIAGGCRRPEGVASVALDDLGPPQRDWLDVTRPSQSAGGTARALVLSPARRTEIAKIAAQARWKNR